MANEEVEKEKRELELQRQKRFSGGPGSRFISGGEHANDFKGTMSRLLKLLKPQLPLILLTFVMTIAYTVASTYAPNKLADMVDIITDGIHAKGSGGGIDFDALRHAALIVGILYALTVVCNLIQQFIMIDVSQNLVYDMRKAIDIKLKKLPIKYFDSHSRGDILSRVSNDDHYTGQRAVLYVLPKLAFDADLSCNGGAVLPDDQGNRFQSQGVFYHPVGLHRQPQRSD